MGSDTDRVGCIGSARVTCVEAPGGGGPQVTTLTEKSSPSCGRPSATVSRRLGTVAGQTAAALEDERLAATRTDGTGPTGAVTRRGGTGPGRGPTVRGAASRPPARLEREASSAAAGARRQASKDAR